MNFSKEALADVRNVSYLTSYRQGFLSTSLNPKALLFYVSILPQFLSNGGIQVKSEVAILSSVVLITCLWFYSVCLFSNILNYYLVNLSSKWFLTM